MSFSNKQTSTKIVYAAIYANNSIDRSDLGQRDEVAIFTRYDGVLPGAFDHRRSDEVRSEDSVMLEHPYKKSN